MQRNERFSVLYKNTIEHFIETPHVVIGCGAIGGYVIRTLGQIGVKHVVLWDFDTIEEVNIGPQGFLPECIGDLKTRVRAGEFLSLSLDSECTINDSRFRRSADHPEKAYWYLCVDDLEVRELIFQAAYDKAAHKIIDTRMGGLNYEVYNCLGKEPDAYLDTIQFARDNPVEEGCTTRSTPHCAMIAASIGINMALSDMPPFSVKGNIMDYSQEAGW